MESLRETAEKDLYDCIESEWGSVIEIMSPMGVTQRYSANNPTELLKGSVRMYSRRENPETGEPVVVDQPSVTVRISSLTTVPHAEDTDNWIIRFAPSPVHGTLLKSYTFTIDTAAEKGTDMGILKLYIHEISQLTSAPVESES